MGRRQLRAWNTEKELVVQQPPTAQNYAIGHVGPKVRAFVPNSDDPRPRSDGYWDKHGQHVSPRSLYRQQLQERLGAPAVENIERTPVGGGSLDLPRVEADLPLTKGIKVDNHWLPGFLPTMFDYIVDLPAGTRDVPEVRPHDERHLVEVRPASHPNGQTILILRDRADPSRSVRTPSGSRRRRSSSSPGTAWCQYGSDMKTIAISIDEESLAAVDRLARATGRRGGKRKANRSEVIRRAVRQFLAHQKRHEREENDRRVLAANREQIEREARVLVAEQAKP